MIPAFLLKFIPGGPQLAMGVVLNLAVVVLILTYIFTLLDPLHIRP